MNNNINYKKLKNILFKKYNNERVLIQVKGEIYSRYWIENSKFFINRNRLILTNGSQKFIISLNKIKNIKYDTYLHIELTGLNAKYILEI